MKLSFTKNNNIFTYLILALVLIFFVAGLHSVFYHSQLFFDGSAFALRALNEWKLPIQQPTLRYVNALIAGPSILAAQMGLGLQYCVWIFCFSYFIYPIAAVIFLIIKSLQLNDRNFVYLVFSVFVLCIVPTWRFATATAIDSVVLGLLFFYYLHYRKSNSVLIFSIYLLALFFSYELSLFYVGASLLFLLIEKKNNKSLIILNTIALVGFILNIFLNLMAKSVGHTFVDSFNHYLYSWQLIYALVFIVLIFAFSFVRNSKIKIGLVVGAALLVLLQFALVTRLQYWNPWNSRTWINPIALLIFCIFSYFKAKNIKIFSGHLLICLILFATGNLVLDLKAINEQKKYIQTLQEVLVNAEGCRLLSSEQESYLRQINRGQGQEFLPLLSILNAKNSNVESIAFSSQTSLGSHANCTKTTAANTFIVFKGKRTGYSLNSNHINFENVLSKCQPYVESICVAD